MGIALEAMYTGQLSPSHLSLEAVFVETIMNSLMCLKAPPIIHIPKSCRPRCEPGS